MSNQNQNNLDDLLNNSSLFDERKSENSDSLDERRDEDKDKESEAPPLEEPPQESSNNDKREEEIDIEDIVKHNKTEEILEDKSDNIILIKQILSNMESDIRKIRQLMDESVQGSFVSPLDSQKKQKQDELPLVLPISAQEKIIEGTFDGQNMIGSDGKKYSVPINYASKSKLVEEDILKLTISPNGSFIYKQIGPIERKRLIGVLTKDEYNNEYYVVVGDRRWRVLNASITYFKGEAGNEIVILVPKIKESQWAAVENIIRESHN